MPREREVHPELLGIAIRIFTSSQTVEDLNTEKPLGSKQLFRIIFNAVTRPETLSH